MWGFFRMKWKKGWGTADIFTPTPGGILSSLVTPEKRGGGRRPLVVSTVGARRARVGYLSALVPRPLGYLPFEREGRPEGRVEVPRVAPDVLRVVEDDFGVGGYLVLL